MTLLLDNRFPVFALRPTVNPLNGRHVVAENYLKVSNRIVDFIFSPSIPFSRFVPPGACERSVRAAA
jgi:hypothetical protein